MVNVCGNKIRRHTLTLYFRNLRGFAISGGGGGIRTHGTLSRTPVFKTGAFDHSAISPLPVGPGINASANIKRFFVFLKHFEVFLAGLQMLKARLVSFKIVF